MATEVKSVDGVTSSSGFAGANPADVAALSSDGSDWAIANDNNTDTDVHVTIANPTPTPTVGAGLQTLSVKVRRNAASGTTDPTARLELWVNGGGAAIQTSGDVTVTSNTSQTISFTFNASSVSASCDDLEAKVFCIKSGGSPAKRSSVDIDYIWWDVDYTVPSADVDIAADGYAQLVLTEQAATLTHDVDITTGSPQALSVTTQAATISVVSNVEITTNAPQALTVTEQTATITADIDISTNAPQSLSVTEQPASISHPVNITAGVKALTLTEFSATVDVSQNVNISTNVDALVLTEQQASIVHNVDIAVNLDTLSLTEQAATVTHDVNIAASTDTLSITTFASVVDVTQDVVINTGIDSLVLTEQAATIIHDVNISAGTKGLTTATNAATIQYTLAGTEISANTAALSLVEYSATVVATDEEVQTPVVEIPVVVPEEQESFIVGSGSFLVGNGNPIELEEGFIICNTEDGQSYVLLKTG